MTLLVPNTADETALLSQPGCSFCDIARGKSSHWIDRPLYETENFVAVPSLGSIVPGWTMIVPKKHVLNCSRMYGGAEFSHIAREVKGKIGQPGKTINIFEHGANSEGSSTGCGVDHAHVHFVPLTGDLTTEIKMLDGEMKWTTTSVNSVDSFVGNNEYLLYSADTFSTLGRAIVAKLDSPTSQFFRRAVALKLGVPDKYDYRRFGFDRNIKSTYELFDRQSNHDRISTVEPERVTAAI